MMMIILRKPEKHINPTTEFSGLLIQTIDKKPTGILFQCKPLRALPSSCMRLNQ